MSSAGLERICDLRGKVKYRAPIRSDGDKAGHNRDNGCKLLYGINYPCQTKCRGNKHFVKVFRCQRTVA